MRSRQIFCGVFFLASAFLLQSALSYGQSGPVGLQISRINYVIVGTAQQFTATRTVLHWFTSDPTIATVDSTGLVTGVQVGGVTITAVSGIFRDSTRLFVISPPNAISLAPGASTIAAGQSTILTPTFSGGAGFISNDQDNSVLQAVNGSAVTVAPAANATYTLVVTSPIGSAFSTATAKITVVPAPKISSFSPSTGIVSNGSSVTLSAVFSGGSGTISPGGISVPVSPGVATVTPSASTMTTYTLTVAGANGSTVTANATVQAVLPPIFTGGLFSGSPAFVTDNANATVTLNIPTFSAGATGVVTNNVNGNVINANPAQGGPLFVPGVNTTTTFILTVTNPAGTSISAPFTVTAVPAPVAASLIPSVTTATSGSSILLFPSFSNGAGIVNNGVGTVGSGSVVSTGSLTSNTTFTLTVTNAAGATASVNSATVNVIPAPIIASFIATPNPIVSGNSTQLTATFSNGTGLISNNVDSSTIPVTSGTPVTVSPTQDTIYTLSVQNIALTVKSANTYVDVN